MKKIIAIILLFSSCAVAKMPRTVWVNSINNPDNQEYVDEIAFDRSIPSNRVTQEQFNERYVYVQLVLRK